MRHSKTIHNTISMWNSTLPITPTQLSNTGDARHLLPNQNQRRISSPILQKCGHSSISIQLTPRWRSNIRRRIHHGPAATTNQMFSSGECLPMRYNDVRSNKNLYPTKSIKKISKRNVMVKINSSLI